jgi:2-polyprenyl-3-methyl-5-hydroxy-6-metoxy-1,4-benzoquinol methylase
MSKSGRYDPGWLSQFYDAYGEKEWARWDKTPEERIKLHVHQHYLGKYLRRGQTVLEIGAGSGRFTRTLSELGTRIVVADLSKGQLELNRINSEKYGYKKSVINWIQMDVCEINGLQLDSFDAIVAYGGLLGFVFEKRAQAMTEMLKVLKQHGVLLLSVMSTWGTVHSALESVLSVDLAQNDQIIESGDLHPDTYSTPNQRVHMFRAMELKEFLGRFPIEIECISASNAISAGYGNRLEPLEKQEEKWKYLLEKEIVASREEGCLDSGTHIIAVGRKR